MTVEALRRTGTLEGRCLCGSATIRIDGDYIAAVGVCHCSLCQRSAGLVWGAFEAAAAGVTVSGNVARYRSTPFAERAFCPVCGSNLWLRNIDTAYAPYEMMPALFPDAAEFPLISEIYTDRAPTYAALSGDHRRATRADYESSNLFVEGDMP